MYNTMRKILISYGYGAGWVSWASGSTEFKQWMLTYQPIIDFLENGGKFTDEDCGSVSRKDKIHTILQQFLKEAKEKFGEDPYIGGATGLKVVEVSGPVRITEYDGAEDYETPKGGEWL